MDTEAKILEEKANAYFSQKDYEQAFRAFREAAGLYKKKSNHKQSALCLASAASCWSIKSGEATFENAAHSYREAALQSELSGDPEYASLLYKYAAINYERDHEFLNYSDCFYRSKECLRKYLRYSLINPYKIHSVMNSLPMKGYKTFIRRAFLWLMLTFSYLIWGYGERPCRAFYFGSSLIILWAFLYMQGSFLLNGAPFKPHFWDALYFSIITFTTVGYGDITAVGLSRALASVEALSGVFVMPVFVVSLTRRYLRV